MRSQDTNKNFKILAINRLRILNKKDFNSANLQILNIFFKILDFCSLKAENDLNKQITKLTLYNELRHFIKDNETSDFKFKNLNIVYEKDAIRVLASPTSEEEVRTYKVILKNHLQNECQATEPSQGFNIKNTQVLLGPELISSEEFNMINKDFKNLISIFKKPRSWTEIPANFKEKFQEVNRAWDVTKLVKLSLNALELVEKSQLRIGEGLRAEFANDLEKLIEFYEQFNGYLEGEEAVSKEIWDETLKTKKKIEDGTLRIKDAVPELDIPSEKVLIFFEDRFFYPKHRVSFYSHKILVEVIDTVSAQEDLSQITLVIRKISSLLYHADVQFEADEIKIGKKIIRTSLFLYKHAKKILDVIYGKKNIKIRLKPIYNLAKSADKKKIKKNPKILRSNPSF